MRANLGLLLGGLLLIGSPVFAQSEPVTASPNADPQATEGSSPALPSAGEPAQDPQSFGTITGTIVDQSTSPILGAQITLIRSATSPIAQTSSGQDGKFAFTNVAPGPFQLRVTFTGFKSQSITGTLAAKQSYVAPAIALEVATAITEVMVQPSIEEIAQEQLKEEEKQRVFGVIPNFYVTYLPEPARLNARQKFHLAWKATIDPTAFLFAGMVAGAGQATNQYGGYGQGAAGYARRYGATYGDFVTSNFLGSAVFPSIFKQDPRYYYKGTGSKKSRAWYAISRSVITKGDNGKWQVDYSDILGDLSSGAISNAYYPEADRGAALTFENALL